MDKININEVFELYNKLLSYEKMDLNDCIFIEDGKEIKISKILIDDFRFTGLINIDFFTTGFYKKGFIE
jgi:hypothetical protein